MAKVSETGQAVLVANFQELIQHCQNFGGQYNPSVADLQIGNLQVFYANTAQQLTDLHTANAEHRVGVAERMEVYKPLSKLGTRLRNAVKIHDLLPSVKEQIVAFTGKMQGAKKKKTTAAPTTDTNIDANLTPANGGRWRLLRQMAALQRLRWLVRFRLRK